MTGSWEGKTWIASKNFIAAIWFLYKIITCTTSVSNPSKGIISMVPPKMPCHWVMKTTSKLVHLTLNIALITRKHFSGGWILIFFNNQNSKFCHSLAHILTHSLAHLLAHSLTYLSHKARDQRSSMLPPFYNTRINSLLGFWQVCSLCVYTFFFKQQNHIKVTIFCIITFLNHHI